MNKQLWFFALLAALLVPAVTSAQKLERTKNWEVGDKVTWNYVLQGKSMRLVDEVVEVTNDEVRSTLHIGDRTLEQALSLRDFSVRKGICTSNGQACTFSPAWVWLDFPLEEGKTWSATSIVSGETFISETAYQYKVEGIEKITTPAGQFDAYRISGSERIKSRSKAGAGPWYGTATFTDWVASINGKVRAVKSEYHNTFGELATRELLAAELR